MQSSTESVNGEQIKTVVEERTDEQGRRVRVTRKIRMRLVQETVSPAVAERRQWAKFGAAAGNKPGPDLASTIPGEAVFLKLSLTTDIDKDLVNKKPTEVNLKSVACRYCDGPHWTSACPYKETFQKDALEKKVAAGETGKETSGKYVPPSQRAREATVDAAGRPQAAGPEPSNTIRIANLSDIVSDDDIRQLCVHFGPVSRVYLAKDQETGRPRGFAFVTFHSMMDAERAAARLNGHLYGNTVLASSMAENRDRNKA